MAAPPAPGSAAAEAAAANPQPAAPQYEFVEAATKNLFSVRECRLTFQDKGDYLCVKVDRYNKVCVCVCVCVVCCLLSVCVCVCVCVVCVCVLFGLWLKICMQKSFVRPLTHTPTFQSKKGQFTNFEIFHTREKQIPVDSLELKERIDTYAFEPCGNRLAVLHGESPRICLSFYQLQPAGVSVIAVAMLSTL